MRTSKLDDRVKTILSDVLGIPLNQIGEDASMQTLEEWGSLKHMELIASLEEAFKVRLTVEQIIEMTSLKSILVILDSHAA